MQVCLRVRRRCCLCRVHTCLACGTRGAFGPLGGARGAGGGTGTASTGTAIGTGTGTGSEGGVDAKSCTLNGDSFTPLLLLSIEPRPFARPPSLMRSDARGEDASAMLSAEVGRALRNLKRSLSDDRRDALRTRVALDELRGGLRERGKH